MSSPTLLPHEQVVIGDAPTSAFICLHGLGASGHDFVPIAQQLQWRSNVRYIFPHAPVRAVTVNQGMRMSAWYDIKAMSIEREVDVEQLVLSAQQVQKFIEREIEQGIDSRHIFVAGFSQGGAVAYHAALDFGQPLGGLICMSTYFATAKQIEFNSANQSIPVLIQHGTQDQIVPFTLAGRAQQQLQAQGYKPKLLNYATGHSVSGDQLTDLDLWLTSQS